METKGRSGSGSGIGRIFSLSLNQAISSNSRSSSGFDKSSKPLLLASPEAEKMNSSKEKSDKVPQNVTCISSECAAVCGPPSAAFVVPPFCVNDQDVLFASAELKSARAPDRQLSVTDPSMAGLTSGTRRPFSLTDDGDMVVSSGKLCSSSGKMDSSSKSGASATVNGKDVRSSGQTVSMRNKSTPRNKALGRNSPAASKTSQDSCGKETWLAGDKIDKTAIAAWPLKNKGQETLQNGSRIAVSSCLEKLSKQPPGIVKRKDGTGRKEKRSKSVSKASLASSDFEVSKDNLYGKGPKLGRSADGTLESTVNKRENKEPHHLLPERASAAAGVGIESTEAPRPSATQRVDCSNRTDSKHTLRPAASQRADSTKTENMDREALRSGVAKRANTVSGTGNKESLRSTAAQKADGAWRTKNKEVLRLAALQRVDNTSETESREVSRSAATQRANASRTDDKETLTTPTIHRAYNTSSTGNKEMSNLAAVRGANSVSGTENLEVLRQTATRKADSASRTRIKKTPGPAATQKADMSGQATNREALRAAATRRTRNGNRVNSYTARIQGGMGSRIQSIESPRSTAMPYSKRKEIGDYYAVKQKSAAAFNRRNSGGFPAPALVSQQFLSSGNETTGVDSSGLKRSPQFNLSAEVKPGTNPASAELAEDALVSKNGSAGESWSKDCVDSAISDSDPEVIAQVYTRQGESKSDCVAEKLQCEAIFQTKSTLDMGEASSAPRSVIQMVTEKAAEVPEKYLLLSSPELSAETETDSDFVQSSERQDFYPQKCSTNLQTVPLARRRQASVSTRMRGNNRLRSSFFRKGQMEEEKAEFQMSIKKVKSNNSAFDDEGQVRTVDGQKMLADSSTSCMVEIIDDGGVSGSCESEETADQTNVAKSAVSKQQIERTEQTGFAESQPGQRDTANGSNGGSFQGECFLEPVDNERKTTDCIESTTMLKAYVSIEQTVFSATPGPNPTPPGELSEIGDVTGGNFEFEGTPNKNQLADCAAAKVQITHDRTLDIDRKVQTTEDKTQYGDCNVQTTQDRMQYGDCKPVIGYACAPIMKQPSPLMSIQTKPTHTVCEQLHSQHGQHFSAVQHGTEATTSSDNFMYQVTRPRARSLPKSFVDSQFTTKCGDESISPPHILYSSRDEGSHTHSHGSLAHQISSSPSAVGESVTYKCPVQLKSEACSDSSLIIGTQNWKKFHMPLQSARDGIVTKSQFSKDLKMQKSQLSKDRNCSSRPQWTPSFPGQVSASHGPVASQTPSSLEKNCFPKSLSAKDFSESKCSKDLAESQSPGSPASKACQVSKCHFSQDPQKSEASKDSQASEYLSSQDSQNSEASKDCQASKYLSSQDPQKSEASKDLPASENFSLQDSQKSEASIGCQASKYLSSRDPQKSEASIEFQSSQVPQKSEAFKDCQLSKCRSSQALQKLETLKQSQFLRPQLSKGREHHASEEVWSVPQSSQAVHEAVKRDMLDEEDLDLELIHVQPAPPEAEQSMHVQSVPLSARLENIATGSAKSKMQVEDFPKIHLEWVDRWRTAWERGTSGNAEDNKHTDADGVNVGKTTRHDSLFSVPQKHASQGGKDNDRHLFESSRDNGTLHDACELDLEEPDNECTSLNGGTEYAEAVCSLCVEHNSNDPNKNHTDSVSLSQPPSFTHQGPVAGVMCFSKTETILPTTAYPQRFSGKAEAKNQQLHLESDVHQQPLEKLVSSRHRQAVCSRQDERKNSHRVEKFTMMKRENCKEQRPGMNRCFTCGSTCTARNQFACKSNDNHCLLSSSSYKSCLASGSRGEKTTQLVEKCRCGHPTHGSEKCCPVIEINKEAKDLTSASRSECSESLPVISDHDLTCLSHHGQVSDSFGNWKELPGKRLIMSQTDSISNASNKHWSLTGEEHFQLQKEAQPSSTTSQACKRFPLMSEGYWKQKCFAYSLERERKINSKKSGPCKTSSTSGSHHCKQVHSQTGTRQFAREQVHPQTVAVQTCRDRAGSEKEPVHFRSQLVSGQNGREPVSLLAVGEQPCREPVDSQNVSGQSLEEPATPQAASDQTCMVQVFSHGVSDKGYREFTSSQAVSKEINKLPILSDTIESQAAAVRSQPQSDATHALSVNCSTHSHTAGERLHSLTHSDLNTNVETSSSSDCDGNLLSQSDCDDLPSGVQGNSQTKVVKETDLHDLCHLRECESSEYWRKMYSGAYQNHPWYPPYTAESADQSYYSPYPTDSGDCWMQPYDPYYDYEHWYNAWLAYSMACYRYGFQEQEQGMGCNKEHECHDSCCSTTFRQLQQSRPSSRPSCGPTSRPPSRPLSFMENPTQGDMNPIHERNPIYPDNSSALRRDMVGNGSTDGPDDREAFHIPCHSIQTEYSAEHLLNYGHKQTMEAISKPDVSFELIVRMENESRAASGSLVQEKKAFPESPESKDMQTSSQQPDSHVSPRAFAGEDYRPIVQLPESSVDTMLPFWRFRARPPPCSTFSLGLNRPTCIGDYHWPPPQFPCPRMPTPLDPYPFCRPPTYPARRPRSATVISSNSGNEDFKDGAREGCASPEQRSYPHWRELPIYPDRNRFYHDGTHFSHLSSPPAPPSFPETGTNSGPETSSSEICPLDSSFDMRGDYDASGSDLEEEEEVGAAASTERRSQKEGAFAQFVAAQKQRYLQIYKDSGSEDPDSSGVASSQQHANKPTGDMQEASSSSSKYVIPSRRSDSGRGLFRYLEKRQIPHRGQGLYRRSCPSAVDTVPVVSSDCGGNAAARKVAWEAGGLSTAAGSSCSSSPGGWWSKLRPPDTVLCDEEYPALPGTTSPSLGSFTKPPAQYRTPHQPASFRLVKEDGTCKTFFRKKPFLVLDTSRPVNSCGRKMSSYSSRLLNDSRVFGSSRWGKEAREAFSRPYQTFFIDTHCHLDFLFNREPYSGSFASYREKNKKTFPANFEGCVAVFCNPKSFTNESKWKPIVNEPRVWMAMGCHPKNAPDYSEWAEMGLRQALKHKKTVALGEIGLDYSKHHGQYAAQQKEVFIRQIKMALEMQLPLVVHCREAEDDCLQILEEHVPPDYKIHCHCFTSGYNSALKWTSRFENLFIGLTPLVTYRSAVDTHEVARLLPLQKLLLETDAPYFLPCGFDGEGISLSHPGLALMVAIKVAELRGIGVEEVLSQVRRNTHHMYNI